MLSARDVNQCYVSYDTELTDILHFFFQGLQVQITGSLMPNIQ